MKNFYLIFEDGDPLRAEVVRAALESAGIDCFIENGGIQNLFSMGSLGGLNPLVGTVKVYIRPEDRSRAEAELVELQAERKPEIPPELEEGLRPGSFHSTLRGKGFLSFLRSWFLK